MARFIFFAVVFGGALLLGGTAAPPSTTASTEPAKQTLSFQDGVSGYAGTVDIEIWAVAPNTCLEGNPNASSDADNDGGWMAVLGDDDPAVFSFEAVHDLGEPVLDISKRHLLRH